MRQTEQYQFNLLDGTDKLSPQPLNENMVTVETALQEAEQELLRKVGSGGYNARIAFGQYTGTGVAGVGVEIETPFKPMVVLIHNGSARYPALVRPCSLYQSTDYQQDLAYVSWTDRGVSLRSPYADCTDEFNEHGYTYYWVAIGYDDSTEE